MVAFLEKSTGSAGFHQIIDFLNRSHICYALTKKPEVCVSFIKQFWRSAEASTDDNGEVKINATIDGHSLSITEGSLRRHLKLADQDGITSIPNSEIFEQLALMGYHTDSDKLTFQKGAFSPQWRFLIHNILHCLSPKKTAWEQFSSNIAAAVICLATNRKFNFSRMIFEHMVSNISSPHKFLMYPRFIQICLDMQRHQFQQHTRTYHVPSLSMKVFSNMKRPTKGYSGQEVALFPTMIDITAPSTSPSRITSSPSHSPEHSPFPTPSPSPEPTPAHTTADITQPSPTQPSPTQPSPTQPSPTQPGAEHHLPTPHDSPLHAVHSHGSDEGSLKLNELTDLVTKLSEKDWILEDDLKTAKQTHSSAFTKLILRVKKLEDQISKSSQESSEKGNTADGTTITYSRSVKEQRKRKDDGKLLVTESEPRKKSMKRDRTERLRDGSSKNYKILSEMLEDFDRQYVEELYRLVKERYSTSRPEGYDLMLWGDLHTLFEPDEEDELWKNQHEYNVIKKKYPLKSRDDFPDVEKKLEGDHGESSVKIVRATSKFQNLLKIGMLVWGKLIQKLRQKGSRESFSRTDAMIWGVVNPTHAYIMVLYTFGCALEDFISVVFVPDRNITMLKLNGFAAEKNSKFGQFSLQRNLPSALNFAKLHLEGGKTLAARDRIEDIKDTINRGALSLGFNEAKRAALMASFIIHKPRERSPQEKIRNSTGLILQNHMNTFKFQIYLKLMKIPSMEAVIDDVYFPRNISRRDYDVLGEAGQVHKLKQQLVKFRLVLFELMGKRISSGCTELVKPFESTNEGQDTSCEPSHLSIDNAPHQGVHKKFRYATNTKEIWNLASYEKVLVTFSETGQPKGNEANELKRFLMTLVRMPQHIGIDYPEWRKVPEDKKENLWKIITGKFAFESPNSEKKIIMRDISHKWKSWKCELKKSSYDPSLTIDEIIASQTDKRVDTSQFKNLVTSWFTEDKHLINQYLLQKAVVKFVDVVEEAIPGLNMSIVTSHINMEVDTISHIDIRNNSLNKNLRSATASHHHNSEIQDKVVPNYQCASTPKNLMCGLILTGLKEKELQGRIKVKMEMQRQLSSILSQLQRLLFNECLVEEESEVEVPVCKSIAIKKEDRDLHFMSCARKCNGQCLHSGHQSANQMAGWVVLAHGSSGRWVKWVMGQTSHRLEMGKKGLGENGLVIVFNP
ncbi:hypothetical protein Tco_1352268 [Tanacetum coccineum]